jgi:arginine utilization protein RocB
MRWQTKEHLTELLCSLVKYPSVTGTRDELAIAEYIHMQLGELSYFQEQPSYLNLHPLEDGRNAISALVKRGNQQKTAILISHFDVVDVDDYGKWKNLAFYPEELTKAFYDAKHDLPDDVQEDLKSGKWMFGRGAMDMKAGIALHMAMVERAVHGQFNGNILFVSVPDEEVNSTGMRGMASVLVDFAARFDLEYTVCLNAEPIFSRFPGDKSNYIYTGSVGKLLPGFLCYGKETHVGEPFSGLNANLMASHIVSEIELSTSFCEVFEGEVTPPPTNLMQRDLKEEYSVQIPHTAVAMFNVLMMIRSVDEIITLLLQSASEAARSIEEHYWKKAQQFAELSSSNPGRIKVNVFTYDQLLKMAVEQYGENKIKRRQDHLFSNRGEVDDRDFTVQVVNDIASLHKDKAPMIVLYFSPPVYPSVCSSFDSHISGTVSKVQHEAQKKHSIELKHQHYFPGLSDLSYVGSNDSLGDLSSLTNNLPLFQNGYKLPIAAMEKLNVPVMNLGPIGRDPHKWTERLELDYSFVTLPDLLSGTLKHLFEVE